MLSEFKNLDRIRVTKETSTYYGVKGTILETDALGHKVALDGVDRPLRFVPAELEKMEISVLELLRTKEYLRELEENSRVLLDAADLLPQGTTKTDVYASAINLRKIASTFRLLLSQDGVKFAEDEDVAK